MARITKRKRRIIQRVTLVPLVIMAAVGIVATLNAIAGINEAASVETCETENRRTRGILPPDGYMDVPLPYYTLPESRDVSTLKLQKTLQVFGSPLDRYAGEIKKLPRYRLALAIAAAETRFCTRGVGASKKNCGAIIAGMNGDGTLEFLTYENELESIAHVARLISSPRYANLDHNTMNGIYCVDESRAGNRCEGWTERIAYYLERIP